MLQTDRLPDERLLPLAQSHGVRKLLPNTHLQRLLTTIDGADDSEQALRNAMSMPVFVEFADAVLDALSA